MRTTLNLDDSLVEGVKRVAAETRRSMTEVIEEALRESLARYEAGPRDFDFGWVTVEGRLLPGLDIDDRDALYDRMEGRS